jgi:hypothetical protein
MRALIVIVLTLAAIGCFAQTQQPKTARKPSAQRHDKKTKASPTPSPSPTPVDASDATATRVRIGAAAFLIPLYWIPAIVAFSRKHHNRGAITVTNFLLGWTAIGWIAALIWACTNPAIAVAKGAAQ